MLFVKFAFYEIFRDLLLTAMFRWRGLFVYFAYWKGEKTQCIRKRLFVLFLGSLSQVCGGGGGGARGRRPQLQPRQAFLFSHHLILGTRAAGGRLHLLPDAGRVPLADAMLVEEPNNMDDGMLLLQVITI